MIENIHQKIADACERKNGLDMSHWHVCETTHCRAGWAVHLAGEEGRKLEKRTSTSFAAMMIFKASSKIKVSPVRFYEKDDVALEDIRRCADLEKTSSQ